MDLRKKINKYNFVLSIILALLIGFVLRIYLTRFGNFGDVSVFTEWGARFWELDLKEFYYFDDWYYSFPTYPPLSPLMYGGLYWLYEQRYILSEIHNFIKIIPSSFIVFFGKTIPKEPFMYSYGYYMLLKIPSILADLGISVLIFAMIRKITSDMRKAFFGMLLYLFNPVTIFLSSVWGQTESLVAFFGLSAFILLVYGNIWLSLPLMFISLFIKPTWMLLVPLFLFLFYKAKKEMKDVAVGVLLVTVIFLVSTYPFSGSEIVLFAKDTILGNMLPAAKGTPMASISAFNFHTIFYQIDSVLASNTFLGIPVNILGILGFVFINLITFKYLSKSKTTTLNRVMFAIFFISFGGYLFLTNMLERYFFAGFAPLIIIAFIRPKRLSPVVVINLILFANLVWVFYRRSVHIVNHLFIDYNFFLITTLSVIIVACYVLISYKEVNRISRKK